MNGLPVAVVENDQVYYIRTDHIGRPVFATDSTGAKVWEVSYLPFGGVHVSTGANIDLRFPGQWFQSESGLHQNWMRDYDPTTGRYMQADPLGLVDGASVYGYAGQNPGRYTDPTGEIIPAIIVGAVGSAVIGFYIDKYFGDDCYTLDELAFDLTLGAAFGGLGKAWGLAGAGWRAGAAGGAGWRAGAAGGVAGEGLAGNPFKGKTAEQIGDMLRNKGYTPKGPNPVAGKGSYINPKTGRKYYIDKGGKYRKGTELPHVDVHRPPGSSLPKRKFPLGDRLIE